MVNFKNYAWAAAVYVVMNAALYSGRYDAETQYAGDGRPQFYQKRGHSVMVGHTYADDPRSNF